MSTYGKSHYNIVISLKLIKINEKRKNKKQKSRTRTRASSLCYMKTWQEGTHLQSKKRVLTKKLPGP